MTATALNGDLLPPAYTTYDEKTHIYGNSNTSRLPPIPQLGTFDRLLKDVSFDDPLVPFIEHWPRGRQTPLGELKLRAQQLGVGLTTKAGLKQGDVVMIISPNTIDFVLVLLATQFAGLKLALANPAYSAKELRHVYHLTAPRKVFAPRKLIGSVVKARIPWNQLVTIDGSTGRQGDGTLSTDELMVKPDEARSVKAYQPKSMDETCYLPCSSGTTGLPKAVEITHQNVSAMIHLIACSPDGHGKPRRSIGLLPFFHAYALIVGLHMTLHNKAQMWILRGFEPRAYLQLIVDAKIQNLTLVPPLVIVLTKLPGVDKKSFASVEYVGCGAAPLDAETSQAFQDKTGVEIRQGWGMTETTVGALGLASGMSQGSVGRPFVGIEARLVDPETGKDVARGERGELWVRGANIMKGYYKNEAATRETKTPDGWLKTGDVAMVNDKGHFFIVDRIKELIKYKGFQVPPAELEALLLSHPKIAAAAVIGVYDKSQGTELPRAYIQLAPGVTESREQMEKEAVEYVKARASHQKHLRGGAKVLDAVPVSASGKILRKELRALAKREEEHLNAARARL